MTLRRVTAPASAPITLPEVKAQLRITHNAEDAALNGMIAAAVAVVDGEGLLGRAMVTQTWAQYVSQSPGWVRLEMGPFLALTSVQYYDDDGALQDADASHFEIRLQDDFVICKPKEGREWPTADVRPDAIKITYTAGFGAAADVPADLKHALLLLVSHWYQNREASTETALSEIPMGFEMLLGAHRVKWYG